MARNRLDLYETAEGVTCALLQEARYIRGTILEPCAGPGRMASVLRRHPGVERVITADVDPQHPVDYVCDATDPAAPVWALEVDFVITNPPFSQAPLILPLAMQAAKIGVAFLLRVTYNEPVGNRAEWLQANADHMRHHMPFGSPRPNFKVEGTDWATVSWFVWLKHWTWKGRGVHPPPFVFITDWNQNREKARK